MIPWTAQSAAGCLSICSGKFHRSPKFASNLRRRTLCRRLGNITIHASRHHERATYHYEEAAKYDEAEDHEKGPAPLAHGHSKPQFITTPRRRNCMPSNTTALRQGVPSKQPRKRALLERGSPLVFTPQTAHSRSTGSAACGSQSPNSISRNSWPYGIAAVLQPHGAQRHIPRLRLQRTQRRPRSLPTICIHLMHRLGRRRPAPLSTIVSSFYTLRSAIRVVIQALPQPPLHLRHAHPLATSRRFLRWPP